MQLETKSKLQLEGRNGAYSSSEKKVSESTTPVPESFSHQRAETVWHSFSYAFAGLWYVFSTQRNAQIHLGISLAIVGLGLFLGIDRVHWAILMVTIGLVLTAEMYNTIIEAIVDMISPEFHPLAKVAKDVAAGAVFFLAMVSAIIGLLILGPALWQYLSELFLT